MKRIKVTKKILDAIDTLIIRYSGEFNQEVTDQGIFGCPLCLACNNHLFGSDWCTGCPNNYFGTYSLGCSLRCEQHPKLHYGRAECYPALKVFWTKFREYAEAGNTSDESIKYALDHYQDEI